MPSIAAPAKVLVTGASGFLATNVTKSLLDAGYTVVGTVRSTPKGEYLNKLYDNTSFSYAIVEDIEEPDAFDEVVKTGAFEGIVHTASPFHVNDGDPQAMVGPAVNGTTNILKTTLKFGSTVKRVVITSSAIAMLPLQPPRGAYTWSEKDWNEKDISDFEAAGSAAPGGLAYTASKTLAERAAWDFVAQHKDAISWDLSVINPSYIFGPIIHEVSSPEKLNTSHKLFFDAIKAKQDTLTPESVGYYFGGLVDVRTVAKAHSQALAVEEAGGKRFLVSDAQWSTQDIYDALNKAGIPNTPEGYPGAQHAETYNVHDNTLSRQLLGLEFPSLEAVAVDTYNSLKERFPGAFA
ncbi:NAD-binding protein [Clavulina sp. PMI_390]|nr:NAD-binding protein [Clavulina sp. PMI_390]